jgi:hypothetical protein
MELCMTSQDTCCSIAPYFKVAAGKLEEFGHLCEQFVEKTKTEPKCLYYGFCFLGDQVHCREGYVDCRECARRLRSDRSERRRRVGKELPKMMLHEAIRGCHVTLFAVNAVAKTLN